MMKNLLTIIETKYLANVLIVLNFPEHSRTISTPIESQLTSFGSLFSEKLTFLLPIRSPPLSVLILTGHIPCKLSNFSKWEADSIPPLYSLICTISKFPFPQRPAGSSNAWPCNLGSSPQAARTIVRPILPNPLIPTRIAIA